MPISDDDGERGRGQSAPHETQEGATTPGQLELDRAAAGNVAESHPTPIGHRGAGASSSTSLTAETITDEQIRELRDEFEAERNASARDYRNAFQARREMTTFGGRHLSARTEAQLATLASKRDEADASYHTALRALGTKISWISSRNTSAAERSEARARCAEILNARAPR